MSNIIRKWQGLFCHWKYFQKIKSTNEERLGATTVSENIGIYGNSFQILVKEDK